MLTWCTVASRMREHVACLVALIPIASLRVSLCSIGIRLAVPSKRCVLLLKLCPPLRLRSEGLALYGGLSYTQPNAALFRTYHGAGVRGWLRCKREVEALKRSQRL